MTLEQLAAMADAYDNLAEEKEALAVSINGNDAAFLSALATAYRTLAAELRQIGA